MIKQVGELLMYGKMILRLHPTLWVGRQSSAGERAGSLFHREFGSNSSHAPIVV